MIGFYAAGAMGGGGAPLPIGTTWDGSLMGSGITLSSGDMIATKAAAGWASVYGTTGKASGKWQVEYVYLTGAGTNRPMAGLADKTNASNVLATYIGNPSASVQESLGYWGNLGRLYFNLSGIGTGDPTGTATNINDIVTVTLDLTLGTPQAQIYRNGTLVHTRTLPSGKTWFPACSLQGGGSVQLRVTGLTHPQAGFVDWG